MVEHRLYEEFEIRGQVLDTESTENIQMLDSNEDTVSESESDDEIYTEIVTQTEGNIIEW